MTFDELYHQVLSGKEETYEGQSRKKLDCLLHPEKYPLVWKDEPCNCEDPKCVTACMFHAMEVKDGEVVINPKECVGCAKCVEACERGNIVFSKDAVKTVHLLKESQGPVYAILAPAYIGQFGEKATPGRIRTALKAMGFAGMIEVAAFADILTLKEALEFCHNVGDKSDFQLTSCCCPIWISMIRKDFHKIAGHLPASVSPMIACARIIKELHPGAKAVFVGPCMAKKAEIREPDLVGDVECVLTFQELNEMFDAFCVDFENMEEDNKEHSATAGRLYARTGGVSQAVKECVESIDSDVTLNSVCACSVPKCKELLQNILEGKIEGNFFEGMGCQGGCVGGPKRILSVEQGTEFVDEYGEKAKYRTPAENPYVIDLIQRLGFQNVDDFVKNSEILTRNL